MTLKNKMERLIEKLEALLPIKQTIKKVIKKSLVLALPYILMDGFIRLLASEVSYYRQEMVLPTICFSVFWITLFVGIPMNLKRNIGRIVYAVCFTVYFLLFLTNCIYFPYTDFFFSFKLLMLAGEGSSYIMTTILNTSPVIYLVCFLILTLAVLIVWKFPKREKGNLRSLVLIALIFLIGHGFTPSLLGAANDNLQWDTWRNPRNVYQNFNDSNKNMKICGLYEYVARDFDVTFLQAKEEEGEEEKTFLDSSYSELTTHAANKYTGIFKGKNVIFVQLEGIDNWLFNKDDMPNLYGMRDHAMVFEDHYSYYNGGGSTFNSELAVNTGLISPITFNQNAYTFSTNLYTQTLPKLFKQQGYSANAFHMNTGEYYSRELNYVNWGYDEYYGLLDEKKYSDVSYELDRELILNESFNRKMFWQDEPFMHYIITYTPHTPFDATKGKGKLLAQEIYGEEIPEMTEEECARMYAKETDNMIGMLMATLKEKNFYDNTVLVLFADHYLYTLNDKTILDKYKNTSNHLINQTPFLIWSSDLEPDKIDKVNSQLDILPTVLNMFGMEYKEELFIGNDIMDPNYQGYVFFSDYSWYDGKVYVENGEVTSGTITDPNYITDMNGLINHLVRKNDLTLKYDYLRRLKK